MGRLEYDTGAFSFFVIALWLAGLVATSYSTFRAFQSAIKDVDTSTVAPTAELFENEFVSRIAKKRKDALLAAKSEALASVKTRVTMLVVGWALFVLYASTRGSSDIQQFDPFEILGISNSATELEIKKAYKKLSLVHHPDRWANKDKTEKALAETRFIMVAKAYEALTDPVARENFQKYGNPDGRQAMEMSIGLPASLLEKENQVWVIAAYLLLSIIAFPASVVLLSFNAAKSGAEPKRIFPDTDELFRISIRNNLGGFQMAVEVFCHAAEFRVLGYRSEDEKKLVLELRNQLVREERYPMKPAGALVQILKQTPALKNSEGNEKALVLVFLHLHRLHSRLNEDLMNDLEYLLSRSPVIFRAMISHARTTCNFHVLTMVVFLQQHMNQAIMPGVNMLLQFPGITSDDLDLIQSEVMKKLKLDKKTENRQSFLTECFVSVKNGTLQVFDEPEKQQEFEDFLKFFPFKELSLRAGTVKEERNETLGKKRNLRLSEFVFEPEVALGDVIHVVVDLKSINPQRRSKNANGCIAHTPFMPHEVKEEWYVALLNGPNPKGFNNIVSGEAKIIAFSTLEDDGDDRLCADLSFFTLNNPNDWMGSADWTVGSHKLVVVVYSNAYVDIDVRGSVSISLIDGTKLPRFKHHEEDEKIDSEPIGLYDMLQPKVEEEADSDFEGDDADE